MSPSHVLDINIQVLKSLQTLHSIGITHNDIKPENIMLDEVSSDKEEYKATLIDFGLSTKYQNNKGEHYKVKEVESFAGNIVFSSLNQMNFKTNGRRDDIISLT